MELVIAKNPSKYKYILYVILYGTFKKQILREYCKFFVAFSYLMIKILEYSHSKKKIVWCLRKNNGEQEIFVMCFWLNIYSSVA